MPRRPMSAASRKLARELGQDLNGLAPPAFAKRLPRKVSAELVHLLDRCTYGYRESELSAAHDLGAEGWLERQLDWAVLDDGGIEQLLLQRLPALSMNYRELARADRENTGPGPAQQLVLATLARQLFTTRQLYELMVEFWTNHFNVFLREGPIRFIKVADDRDHVRPHALGRFSDLLHASAASPSMLFYLDNYSNTREGPNENYARELMELHTLGVDGGYGEEDVREVARCFTGWTLNRRHPQLFVFDPRQHDDGPKTVLGQAIAPGGGIEDGRRVLDILAAHPATARFIAGKLCRRFIADEPPVAAVTAVADSYRASGGDIRSMLRTLFGTAEFADSVSQKFKRPGEYLISVLRRLDAETRGAFLVVLADQLMDMGQVPYMAAPPTGYADRRSGWLSTSGLLQRWNFATAVALGEVPLELNGRGPNARDLPMQRFIAVNPAALIAGARTPEAITDRLIERVLHRPLPNADRHVLLALAASGAETGRPMPPAAAVRNARLVLAALLACESFQTR